MSHMGKYEIAKRIFEAGDNIATTGEMLKEGIHTSYIADLVKSSLIARIKRGVYEWIEDGHKVRQLAGMTDVQARWSRFASRLGIQISLVEVLDIVCTFLEPVFEAIVNEREIFGTWDPAQRRYVSVSNHS